MDKKSKMQFSKKICVYGMFLVTITILGNFMLIWFGRDALSDMAISVVSMFGGFATGGYFALSGVRDCSVNKYGNRSDQNGKN